MYNILTKRKKTQIDQQMLFARFIRDDCSLENLSKMDSFFKKSHVARFFKDILNPIIHYLHHRYYVTT